MAEHEIIETGEPSSAGVAKRDSSLADGQRKFGRYDMEDEDNFPKVESVSDDGLRNEASKRRRVFDSFEDDYYPLGLGDAGMHTPIFMFHSRATCTPFLGAYLKFEFTY